MKRAFRNFASLQSTKYYACAFETSLFQQRQLSIVDCANTASAQLQYVQSQRLELPSSTASSLSSENMHTLSRSLRGAVACASSCTRRHLHQSAAGRAKVLVKLYDDPADPNSASGQTRYPPPRVRDSIPLVQRYPDGQSVPSPRYAAEKLYAT